MEDSNIKDQIEQLTFEFTCSGCSMAGKAHYKGCSPPFSRNVKLKYPGYVMKDPFSPPGKGEILVLGADCAVCDKPVCISKDCSVFYTKNYCKNCAYNCLDKFPAEIKNKISQQKRL